MTTLTETRKSQLEDLHRAAMRWGDRAAATADARLAARRFRIAGALDRYVAEQIGDLEPSRSILEESSRAFYHFAQMATLRPPWIVHSHGDGLASVLPLLRPGTVLDGLPVGLARTIVDAANGWTPDGDQAEESEAA